MLQLQQLNPEDFETASLDHLLPWRPASNVPPAISTFYQTVQGSKGFLGRAFFEQGARVTTADPRSRAFYGHLNASCYPVALIRGWLETGLPGLSEIVKCGYAAKEFCGNQKCKTGGHQPVPMRGGCLKAGNDKADEGEHEENQTEILH